MDKIDETEENVTSGDLEDVKETRVARSFPEKSASKVHFYKIIESTEHFINPELGSAAEVLQTAQEGWELSRPFSKILL